MDYHALTSETAAMLRTARQRRGLSIREAARILNTGRGYLSMLETAQRAPSESMAALVARVYHLEADEAEALKAESVAGTGRDKPSRKKAAA